MRPREHPNLRRDRSNILHAATIGPLALFENTRTHGALLDVTKHRLDGFLVIAVRLVLFDQAADHVLGHRGHRLVPFGLVGQGQRLIDSALGHVRHLGGEVLVRLDRRPVHVGDRVPFQQFTLDVDELLDTLMCGRQAFEDLGLTHLYRAAFHHQNGVFSTRNQDIEVGVFELLECGIEYPRTLDPAYTNGRHQGVEWDFGHVQRHRSAEHAEYVSGVFLIGTEHETRDLRLVLESLGKQRADRPIRQARREDRVLARPTLALEEATGNLPGRVTLFLEFYGQGEKR